MSYDIYKILHLVGFLMLFLALGFKLSSPDNKRFAGPLQGIALVILLVAGFGLLARLKIAWPWPLWVWTKLVIWLALGGMVAFIRRCPERRALWTTLIIALGSVAAMLAVLKPF